MELSQLRYFCEVARTEHMTRSARNLHVAQPALTRSIHRLEGELGVPLFERAGRNIRLTDEGAFFHGHIAPVLEGLDAAVADVRGFAEARQRTIRVNVLSASGLVVDAIAAFAEGSPDAAFEVTQSKSDERCDIRVDTVLPSDRGRARSVNAAEQMLLGERIGVAVPFGSDYAEAVALADVAAERFICLAGSRRFRELCDALCARHGVALRIGFDSDSPAVVKKMIALGLGVGFWPQFSWGSLDGSGARWLPLAEDGFERVVSVQLAAHAQKRAMAQAFYRFLAGALQERMRG